MSKAELVKRIIAEQLGIEESTVTTDKHLVSDLGADSLDEVEIVMYLEDEFCIAEIPEVEAESLKTVADFIACVERRA